ncbi:MAG: hypothetical protein GEV09_20120 [Pseudonocardiaceae bacterium]|nr:hypothetical protein [Pseudonocardiaceae bacterium]
MPSDRDDLEDGSRAPDQLLTDAATHLRRLADGGSLADLDGALVAVAAGTVEADGAEHIVDVQEADSREITEAIGYAITEYALLRDRAEDAMLRALILLDQAERREESTDGVAPA